MEASSPGRFAAHPSTDGHMQGKIRHILNTCMNKQLSAICAKRRFQLVRHDGLKDFRYFKLPDTVATAIFPPKLLDVIFKQAHAMDKDGSKAVAVIVAHLTMKPCGQAGPFSAILHGTGI